MRPFFNSAGKLIGAYLLYKIVLIIVLLSIRYSSYNPLIPQEHDYGEKTGNIVIAGFSNVKFGFNYRKLNTNDSIKVRSSSCTYPWGVYLLMKKIKYNVSPNETIVFDLAWESYNEDLFLPSYSTVFSAMTINDYKNVFVYSPGILMKYALRISLFNNEYIHYIKTAYTNWRKNKRNNTGNSVDEHYLFDSQRDDPLISNTYFDCNNKYNKLKHSIRSPALKKDYLNKLKQYINRNFSQQHLYYYFPEINKGNNTITKSDIDLLTESFHPINEFNSSEFLNAQMYDQHYHLNYCGAEVNTGIFLKSLYHRHTDCTDVTE